MGMFDNIIDHKLVCPFCGSGSHIEIQTKDLDCVMRAYYVTYEGEELRFVSQDKLVVSDKLAKIDGYATCRSPICMAIERMRDLVKVQYTSGFSRSFRVRYNVVDCKIVGPAEIDIENDTDTYASVKAGFIEYLKSDQKMTEAFEPILAEHDGEHGLAVLAFHYMGREGFKVIHPEEI